MKHRGAKLDIKSLICFTCCKHENSHLLECMMPIQASSLPISTSGCQRMGKGRINWPHNYDLLFRENKTLIS